MSNYYKPQTPLAKGDDFIYPLTTADQVLLEDGSRLNAKVVMAALDDAEDGEDYNPDEVLVNAESLGGIPANSYMLKTDTAVDSTKLNGKPASDYLLKTDEVENSAKLNGKPASDYSLREDTVFAVNGNLPDENGNVSITTQTIYDRNGNGNNINFAIDDYSVGIHESLNGYHAYLYKNNGSIVIYNPAGETINVLYGTSYKPDTLVTSSTWVQPRNEVNYPGIDIYGTTSSEQSPSFQGSIRLSLNADHNGYKEIELVDSTATKSCRILTDVYGTATDSTKFNNKTWAEMLLANYPVGAIYLSVNSTSPASLFGGTWEQLKDRFLLGAGSSYSNGATGGATTHTHTTANHTLTINEMPYHNHDTHFGWSSDHAESYIGTANGFTQASYKWTSNGYLLDMNTATYAGGGAAHNHGNTGSSSNLPPYLAVYMWKRVS